MAIQKRSNARRYVMKQAALKAQAEHLNYYIVNDIISKSQVIACTLVGANNQMLKGMTFETVFIDEAAQALEPASWIPILKSNRSHFCWRPLSAAAYYQVFRSRQGRARSDPIRKSDSKKPSRHDAPRAVSHA